MMGLRSSGMECVVVGGCGRQLIAISFGEGVGRDFAVEGASAQTVLPH